MADLSLADRLKLARDASGLTRAKCERRADVAAGTLVKLESGERENPTLSTLQALAGALGVSVEWLAFGSGDGPTEEPPAKPEPTGDATAEPAETAKGAA
jgi:transcriptional regulator with XRE-family HTH domain